MELKNYEEAKRMLTSTVESIAKDHTLMTRSLLNGATEFYKTLTNIKRMSEGQEPLVFDKPTIEELKEMGKPLEPQMPEDIHPPKFYSGYIDKKEEPAFDAKKCYENLNHIAEGMEAMGKLLYETQMIIYKHLQNK